MKTKPIEFPRRYATALRRHLNPGERASLLPALRLGRQAAALGLNAFDLVRIHEEAIAPILAGSRTKKTLSKRADLFFNETLTPILEIHRASRRGSIDQPGLDGTLSRHTTSELGVGNSPLPRGKVRHENVEVALKRSRDYYRELLNDSMELQEAMRQLTHQALAGQEDERRTISRELRNEIAQTLLSIHVRLLILRKVVRGSPANFEKDLACTKRSVKESLQSINRFVRQLRNRGRT